MVEHIEFREFVGSLQSLFKVVSKNTLKSDILKIYDNERENVLKMMDKNGCRIVITTNMWTSSTKRERVHGHYCSLYRSHLDVTKPGFKVIL